MKNKKKKKSRNLSYKHIGSYGGQKVLQVFHKEEIKEPKDFKEKNNKFLSDIEKCIDKMIKKVDDHNNKNKK